MNKLREALARNKHLRHVELDNCEIADQGGISIGEALIRGSRLRFLSIRNNEISDEGIIKIAEGLHNNPNNMLA